MGNQSLGRNPRRFRAKVTGNKFLMFNLFVSWGALSDQHYSYLYQMDFSKQDSYYWPAGYSDILKSSDIP